SGRTRSLSSATGTALFVPSATCAVIAPARSPRGLVREPPFIAPTTAGPTRSTAASSVLPKSRPPLADYLGNIQQLSSAFPFKGLSLAERRDYYVNCNWKVYVDNYLEGYHIPIVHPGLMRELDYSRYR